MKRSKPRRGRPVTRVYTLAGGPYAGQQARLAEGCRCTLPFAAQGQRGRYVWSQGKTLSWEPSNG